MCHKSSLLFCRKSILWTSSSRPRWRFRQGKSPPNHPPLYSKATRRWVRSSKRRVSFVDEVSFVVMNERRIEVAFAFDRDFEDRGFRLLAPSS